MKFFLISFEHCRINNGLFGLNPVWFHLTNILMHATVCVLFTNLCINVAGLQKMFGVIAGIVFAAHPIHTEAVSEILYCYLPLIAACFLCFYECLYVWTKSRCKYETFHIKSTNYSCTSTWFLARNWRRNASLLQLRTNWIINGPVDQYYPVVYYVFAWDVCSRRM